MVFCKNRPNWNQSFSNFGFLTSNSDSSYQNTPEAKIFLFLIYPYYPTRGVKVHIAIFFLTYIIKVPHVIYHWIALELDFPKILLIPRYIPSPKIIWQKCHFRKKTFFLDFKKIKKQPNLNFYIFRKTIRWCIRIKNKTRVFCFSGFPRSQKRLFSTFCYISHMVKNENFLIQIYAFSYFGLSWTLVINHQNQLKLWVILV